MATENRTRRNGGGRRGQPRGGGRDAPMPPEEAAAAAAPSATGTTGSTRPEPPAESIAEARNLPTGMGRHPTGGSVMNRILLVDLSERELKERMRLEAELQRLTTIENTAEHSGGLTADQLRRKNQIKVWLDSDITVDRFYQAVAAAQTQVPWEKLRARNDFVLKYGLFGTQRLKTVQEELENNEREIAGICGLLQLDNIVEPERPKFTQKVIAAMGEYRENRELFDKVFETLSSKYNVRLQSQIDKQLVPANIIGCIEPNENPNARGDARSPVPAATDTVSAVSTRSIAATVRRLAENGVSANDPWLASHIENTFDMQTGVTNGAPPSALEIMLPDFEDSVDIEIVTQNLHAIQAHYFAFMSEEMRIFQVVEKIVELFRQGLLPLGRGKAGDYLYSYYKKAGERITESERRDLYMRAFGAPGGDPNGAMPNREFNELWLRFVSAVSSFARQLTVEKMLRANVPMAVSQEQVRKSGRDLAANLSLHGYGIAYFSATELQSSLMEFRDVLSDPELRGAFGARDMWQVIDQVNANYLGGTKNTHRYRTQARAGAVVIRWLANHHQRLTGRYGTEAISIGSLTNPQLAQGSDRPLVSPNDWDLVQACEQWLAVGGVQDMNIEQYAQPIESPVITSKPIEMPQAARDILDSVGISVPSM